MIARYKAVVFDLDGVLWDGEPLYHEAFNVVLKPRGHTVTTDDYTQIMGNSVELAWEWVLNRFGIEDSPERFYREYDSAVIGLMQASIEPLPGVRDLLGELKTRGIPVGLASASLRNWVDATLGGIGLNAAFATTVTASEVTRSKPAPDLYLKAAENLRIDPALCVAVEDSRAGVRSAKAAGMYTIQTRASTTALPPLDEADAVIETYAEFDFSLLGG